MLGSAPTWGDTDPDPGVCKFYTGPTETVYHAGKTLSLMISRAYAIVGKSLPLFTRWVFTLDPKTPTESMGYKPAIVGIHCAYTMDKIGRRSWLGAAEVRGIIPACSAARFVGKTQRGKAPHLEYQAVRRVTIDLPSHLGV